uniref:Kazal-like domain-containing protein n=2 Tax=Lygus hesperus TaxID=30085 RepID=A0A0K8T943_LYGHE
MTSSAILALVTVMLISYDEVMSYPEGLRGPRQLPTSSTPEPAPGVVYMIPNCDCQTTSEYNPVCGSNGVTYQNRQKLECAASCGTDVRLRRSGNCSRSLQVLMERRNLKRN